MPREIHSKSRKQRRVPSPLPRQRVMKPAMIPTQIARREIAIQLSDLLAACDGLFKEHGDSCTCELCCLVSNMVGSLRLNRMLLEIT